MTITKRLMSAMLIGVALLTTSACDKIANSSRAAQEVTRNAFEDTKSSWRDFFMYHPPVPDSLPQTRYCYQMQSDVVCYDSEQTLLTSKLVGYQDGENISWVQPGGGSLGASGGEAVALRPLPKRQTSTATMTSNTKVDVETGPVPVGNIQSTYGGGVTTSGQISVNSLPPATVKKN